MNPAQLQAINGRIDQYEANVKWRRTNNDVRHGEIQYLRAQGFLAGLLARIDLPLLLDHITTLQAEIDRLKAENSESEHM